ncbi:MAG: 23S rRNA (guanosine(2251)-2'-O)-methyltransferase RlmB [Gammaproteobacteria bacterium]|nr:23S rRNA (guanosine(2251)-2'-O)-methyltransferase RlmB [Gammaproteobacteria bacterium]
MAGGGRNRLYGLHAVRGLLDTRPEAVVAAQVLEGSADGRLQELVGRIEALGATVRRVRRAELDRASGGGRHQGIVVDVAAPPEFTLGAFEDLVVARGNALRLLILDGVEDPRNLGACLRTADAAGMDAVVVPRSRAAKLTPAALKAATGAAETVPLLYAPNLARALAWLRDAGVRLVGADSAADRGLFESRLEPPIGLVLGGEGRGLKRLTREHCDEIVAIPMVGTVESLNVSVAAAIVMFELLRQAPAGRGGA